MRSFNDVVYGILNENDGLPAMPAYSPPGGGALAKRQRFLDSGQLPVVSDEASIGDMIYNLIESLDEDTKTNTGARVKDVLEDILNELEDIATAAKRSSDPSEIDRLIRRLSLD